MDPSPVFGVLIDFWPLTLAAGCTVVYLGWKRLSGRLRLFVVLTGGSVVGFFLAVMLHNVLWWLLFVKLLDRPTYDEPVFFIIAVIVCPLAFIVGVTGIVVTMARERMGTAGAGRSATK